MTPRRVSVPETGLSRPRAFRRVTRIVALLLLIYLAPLILLTIKQQSLIFAGTRANGFDSGNIDLRPGSRFERLTTENGDTIACLFEPGLDVAGSPQPAVAARATVLYCYGNGSSIGMSVPLLEPLRQHGINIVVFDYVGYGMSRGDAGERGCYAAADAAYAYATSKLRIPPSKIVIVGWSLGSAVAIDLAARVPAAGLASVSAFTSMADLAHHNYPIYPVFMFRAVLRYPFDNAGKIGRVTCPILSVHGTNDEVVPFAMQGRLLPFTKAPVERVVVDGGRHDALFADDGYGMDRLCRFVERVTTERTMSRG